jgi:hypothetical protein
MDSISGFFGKFLKLQQDSEEVKNKIITTIKELSGTVLEKERIAFKDGNISTECSPLERTQIYLNKERILEKLNSLGVKALTLR